MTASLQTMSPREFVRGLMRGDRSRFKTGYSAENAVIAVCEIQGVPEGGPVDQREGLLNYALGFGYGLHRVEYLESFAPQAMQEGYIQGLAERGCLPG